MTLQSVDDPATLPVLWPIAMLLILGVYFALAAAHIYHTPVATSSEFNYINAPDEAAHIGYVRAIAEGHRLPTRGDTNFPTYEWHQPPLYYAIASPLFNSGPIALRWLSAAIGFITLILMFRICRLLYPNESFVPVMTLGFAALLPMRHAIMSSVGNDCLIEMLFVAEFLAIMNAIKSGLAMRGSLIMGLVLGAALLTKATAFLLIPFICVAYSQMLRNGEGVKVIWQNALVCFGLAAFISSFWFVRNEKLYGEFTPARAFLREFEGTKKANDIIGDKFTRADYLREVALMTAQSFFAAYTPHPAAARNGSEQAEQQRRKLERFARNGIPLFSEAGFYLPYGLYFVVGIVGLIRLHSRKSAELTSLQTQAVQLSLALIALVAASFAVFVWTFFQTQGRYLYPALFPFSLCLAIGMRAILPRAFRASTALVVNALFLILAVAFLYTAIIPSYS